MLHEVESAAIIPAAGRSRRMGAPKWRLPYQGKIVLGAVVGAFRDGGVQRLTVVARPDDAELAHWVRSNRMTLAINPEPDRGMLSSVVAGLEALGGAERWSTLGRALLICPADLPALTGRTVARVLAAVEEGARLAVPVWRGRRGHPLALGAQLVAAIPTADPDIGLRELLDRYAAELQELVVDDPGCVRDVDTPEDYGEAVRRAE